MLNVIKIKNKDIRVVLENFISLSMLQLLNNLLPIVTMPYLVRVLGPGKYGLISYAQAVMQYFINFTDYGFNLTATRQISINRGSNEEISKIFSTVMLIKTVFMIISLGILWALMLVFPPMREEWMVYLLTFGMVLGNVMFPTWFFQGIEKMKYITFINAGAKSLFTIGIFILVKTREDYLFVPLLYTLGFIVSGVIALELIIKRFEVKLMVPRFRDILGQLKSGWHVFLSTLMMSFNSNSSVIILGIVCSNTIVGYYSAGEKLIRAMQRMLMPVQQAVYPYLSRVTASDRQDGVRFLRRLTLTVGSFTFIVSAALLAGSAFINNILLGTEFHASLGVFRVLSFMIFFNAIGSIFGMQTMLAYDFKKEFTAIIFLSLMINILLSFILSIYYKQIGSAIAVLTSEIFICVTSFIFINIKGIRIVKVDV